METLEPSKDNRKKFDLDLAYGKVRENMVADMLQDKKIEVKSERDMWARTGNIAIEYQCWSELLDDMLEAHTIPVLTESDYKITKDSYEHIKDCAEKMRNEADKLSKRIEGMGLIGNTLN